MNVVSHEATTKLGGNEPAAALELNASILILEDRLLFRESLATAVAAAWPRASVQAARLGEGHRHPGDEVDLILLSTAGERRADQIAAAVRHALRDHPDAAVLVLTDSADARMVEAAKAAGARGLATTSATSVREAVSTLRRVQVGGQALLGPGPVPTADLSAGRHAPLADDERAILAALASGKSNPVIAADLGLSEIVVKLELRRLLRKYGLVRRAQLVARAQELVEPARIFQPRLDAR